MRLYCPSPRPAASFLELLAAALDGTGPAVLPLDPDLPADRLAAILDTFAPAAVHTPDGVTRRADSRPAAEDTAVVIATSGSTGQPKGVELSAAALRHSARATLDRVGAAPGQRWLLCLPATHIAGIQVLIRSLVAGTDPVVVTRADADVLAGSGCAHVSIVPTQLRRLLDADPGAAWAQGFASVLLGGAAAPAALVDGARAAGVPVITTYGMSETCGGCVYDGRPLAGVTVTTAAPAGDAGGADAGVLTGRPVTAGSGSAARCCSPATGVTRS